MSVARVLAASTTIIVSIVTAISQVLNNVLLFNKTV